MTSINKPAFVVVFLPLLATIFFFAAGFQHRLHAFTVWLFLIVAVATGFGITVGFHRLLTHRSFIAHPFLRWILISLGCMAFEGPPFFWVAMHRLHHLHSDDAEDPHTPNYGDNKLLAFYHAHVSWMYREEHTTWDCYAPDLLSQKDVRFISKHYLAIATIGLWLPMLINWLYYQTWYALFEGLIFCGLIRVCIVHNLTWSINSVCHVFGYQTYKTGDKSRNNIVMGVIGLGEGWHNNHHAFPFSARHGLAWWQLDLSYCLIRLCALLGLVRRYRLPTAEQMSRLNKIER